MYTRRCGEGGVMRNRRIVVKESHLWSAKFESMCATDRLIVVTRNYSPHEAINRARIVAKEKGFTASRILSLEYEGRIDA